MPGFNGTGPQGSGPMTGRGRGYCMSYVAPSAKACPGFSRRDTGRGWRNWCHAAGQTRRQRRAPGAAVNGAVFAPPLSGEQELSFIKEQAGYLENALEQAKRRIKELEGKG